MLTNPFRLAGSDTTGISLRAVFYYLIMNPRSYAKLVDEILLADREGKASKNITLAEGSQMVYLYVPQNHGPFNFLIPTKPSLHQRSHASSSRCRLSARETRP